MVFYTEYHLVVKSLHGPGKNSVRVDFTVPETKYAHGSIELNVHLVGSQFTGAGWVLLFNSDVFCSARSRAHWFVDNIITRYYYSEFSQLPSNYLGTTITQNTWTILRHCTQCYSKPRTDDLQRFLWNKLICIACGNNNWKQPLIRFKRI